MRNARPAALLGTIMLVATLGTACGNDDTADPGTDVEQSTAETSEPMETSEEMPTSDEMESPDMSTGMEPVGAGCADYAAAVPDGEGSVAGMADDPVSVAASNNPILTTLVSAVTGGINPAVDLASTLDGGEFTVLAPVDDAFAAVDPATLDALAADDGTLLTTVLTYHVIPGRLAPEDLVGSQTTVQGEMVEIAGEPEALTVNGSASVVCGNVQTANATVYLIDAVLMPPSMM